MVSAGASFCLVLQTTNVRTVCRVVGPSDSHSSRSACRQPPDRGVGDGVEPDLQPGFEPGEVRIAGREQPVVDQELAEVFALAERADRLVETDPADPAVGPGDADLSGRPAAAVAGEPAGAPRPAAGRGSGDGPVVVRRDGQLTREGFSHHGRSGRAPA